MVVLVRKISEPPPRVSQRTPTSPGVLQSERQARNGVWGRSQRKGRAFPLLSWARCRMPSISLGYRASGASDPGFLDPRDCPEPCALSHPRAGPVTHTWVRGAAFWEFNRDSAVSYESVSDRSRPFLHLWNPCGVLRPTDWEKRDLL